MGLGMIKKIPLYEYFLFIVAISAGFVIGYMEWGNDWDELPTYSFLGGMFYLIPRGFILLLTLSTPEAYKKSIFEFLQTIRPYEYILLALAMNAGFLFGYIEWGNDWEELRTYSLFGGVYYLFIRGFYFLMTLGLSSSLVIPPIVQSDNKIVVDLILSQRDRARKLKIAGRFILLAIMFSIAAGIQVFYSADSSARSNNGEFRLRELSREFESIAGIGPRYFRDSKTPEDMEKLDDFLLRVKQVIKDETDRFIEHSNSDPQEVIISTLSTRIGVIFLLIFLVQILVSMYRYSIKLAALYDSRADMLQLLPEEEALSFEKLTILTTTENIDFTKQDKAPADYALELAKKIIEKSGK